MRLRERSDRFESTNLRVARMCVVIVLLDSCSHFLRGAAKFCLDALPIARCLASQSVQVPLIRVYVQVSAGLMHWNA
jgi:hypothetical protein